MKKLLTRPQMLYEARQNGNGHALGLEVLFFIIVFFVSQSILSIPVTVAMLLRVFLTAEGQAILLEMMEGGSSDALYTMLAAPSDAIMLVQLFSTALATAAAIVYCRIIEKRSLSSMGLRRRGLLREYGIGTLIGIALISVCVGLCLPFGAIRLEAQAFSPVLWVLFLLGFLIQGMSEEVLCRGYMMVSVSRRHSLVLAVLTNSVLFGLLHIFNPGFGLLPLLNIVLFGILESVYVLKRGDLWGACAIHSIWNFFQGNVFGISVSGMELSTSPLRATVNSSFEWLNGGSFGLEGGVAVTLVLAIACVLVLFLMPNSETEAENEQENSTLPSLAD